MVASFCDDRGTTHQSTSTQGWLQRTHKNVDLKLKCTGDYGENLVYLERIIEGSLHMPLVSKNIEELFSVGMQAQPWHVTAELMGSVKLTKWRMFL